MANKQSSKKQKGGPTLNGAAYRQLVGYAQNPIASEAHEAVVNRAKKAISRLGRSHGQLHGNARPHTF